MENVPNTSQKSDSKGQDIRNAVSNVVAASGALARTDLNPEQEDQVEAIREAAGRILDFVSSTLGDPAPEFRLLLVEDDPINRKVITKLLAGLGHSATTVQTGNQALDALEDSFFDVVFMDITMPGIGGLEATRMIRDHLPKRRQPWIVALTAAVLPEDRLACREAGADDFLAKPVRAEELQAAIDRATRRAGSAANVIPIHSMKLAVKPSRMDQSGQVDASGQQEKPGQMNLPRAA